MAYLLGSKSCLDSLRVDIDDLQNVIHDIIGKTGSIKCHSWKFPDKLATEVDIKELLERYQHGTNELDNQVSHVVLFEIVIDRLLLVLHGSWRYLHDMQKKFSSNTLDSSSTINQQTGLSVGLVVKKYWNKLLHLFTVFQEEKIRPERIQRRRLKSSLTIDKHVQTIETSFSPCSSCIQLQQYFRQSSDSLINLCNTYNLPSSLAYHRCSTSVIPEWLSSDDIEQWFDCQTKDFDRLAKHLEYFNSTLNQTKTDLETSENHSKQQNQRLQQIIDDDQQAKRVLQEVYDNHKRQCEQNALKLNEQMKLLTTQKSQLEVQLKEINNQCTSRGEELKTLESSKDQLKILTEDRVKSGELRRTLEENCIRFQTELEVVKRDLEERNHDLKKERMRIENLIRQEENQQSKQKTLTKSNEDLSNECQSLRKQISELESQHGRFQRTNDQALQEIASLQSNLEQFRQREQSYNLHRPSQIPPVDNHLQNQLRMNERRLDLLEKENESLKSSLEKLLVSNHTPVVTEERYEELRNQSRQEQSYRSYSHSNETRSKPAPLWLLNNEILEQQAFTDSKPVTSTNYIPRFSENDYAANGWIKPDPDVIPFRPATRIQSSRPSPPVAEREMIVGKGRRNLSSARTRRSSTTHITNRSTN